MKTEDIMTSLYMTELPAVNQVFSEVLGTDPEAWYRRSKDTFEDGSYKEENWFLTRDRVIISVTTKDDVLFTSYERSNIVRVDRSFEIKVGYDGKEVVPTRVLVVMVEGESLEIPPPRDRWDHWASKYNDFVSKL